MLAAENSRARQVNWFTLPKGAEVGEGNVTVGGDVLPKDVWQIRQYAAERWGWLQGFRRQGGWLTR